jgi:hypothetical protein
MSTQLTCSCATPNDHTQGYSTEPLAWHSGIKDQRIWRASLSSMPCLAHFLHTHLGVAKKADNRSLTDSQSADLRFPRS